MGDKLTPKQEEFARVYVETSNASEAYRQAYDVGENTKPSTVWDMASKALAVPLVTHRVMMLQKAAQERTLVTLESLTAELNEDRALARENLQSSAAISAVMGKAKVNGLLVEKQEIKHHLSDALAEMLAKARK